VSRIEQIASEMEIGRDMLTDVDRDIAVLEEELALVRSALDTAHTCRRTYVEALERLEAEQQSLLDEWNRSAAS
jgi:hypothetical protein